MTLPASIAWTAHEPIWDAVVIGAGPAGGLAARQLALSGARVLLVDRKAFPRAKVCGGCFNHRSLSLLHQVHLTAQMAALGGETLRQFQMHSRGRPLVLDVPLGLAVSRSKFDAMLVAAAIAAGVRFLPLTAAAVGDCRPGARTVRLVQQNEAVEVAARVVLAADGLGHPSLAQRPEFACRISPNSRLGAGCLIPSPTDYGLGTIFMGVGRQGYVGLARVEDGQLNLAAAIDPAFVKQHHGLGPAVAALLHEARLPPIPGLAACEWLATPALTRRTPRLAAERLFVLGDAAGYIEPFTGEGIAWALTSAVAITPLVEQGIRAWRPALVQEWPRMHRRLVRRRQTICRCLSTLLRHPLWLRATVELCRIAPGLAQPLLARINEDGAA